MRQRSDWNRAMLGLPCDLTGCLLVPSDIGLMFMNYKVYL